MWETLCVIIVVLVFVHWIVKWKMGSKDKMPGPLPLPLFGNSLEALRYLKTIHRHMLSPKYTKYGKIARIWLAGMIPVVFVNDPEQIHQMLVSKQQIYDRSTLEQQSFASMLEDGLLMQNNGKHWEETRHTVGPAFHRNSLKQMNPLFTQRAEILIEKLKLFSGSKETVDMQSEFQKLTFDVIGLVSMGLDFQSQTQVENQYEKAWDDVLNQLMFQFYFPLPRYVWKWLTFFPSVRRYYEALQLLETAIQEAIQIRRVNQIQETDSDLVSLMLRAQASEPNVWTEKRIRRELLTFIFAGHDTTRSTLCWALYYIVTSPEIEDRVLSELNNLPEIDKIKTFETILDPTKLKYLKMVINETLRLRPPAPVRGRTLSENDTLSTYELPKNSHCVWSPYAVHHNGEYWENPEEFDPSRFSEENFKKIPRCSYIPFGAGLRRCIGENMALNEIMVVISLVLLHYRFVPKADVVIQDEWAITLSMANGLPMYVEPR